MVDGGASVETCAKGAPGASLGNLFGRRLVVPTVFLPPSIPLVKIEQALPAARFFLYGRSLIRMVKADLSSPQVRLLPERIVPPIFVSPPLVETMSRPSCSVEC